MMQAKMQAKMQAILAALLIAAAGTAMAKAADAPAQAAKPAEGAQKAERAPGANSANDACLACHKDPSQKSAAGKSIGLDAALHARSVHGGSDFSCTDCHDGLETDKAAPAGQSPHGKVSPPECGTCHRKQAREYKATIHGKARAAGKTVAATCSDCHGKHDIAAVKDDAARTSHANIEKTCGACHGNDAVIAKGHIPGGNVAGKYHDSIHGKTVAGKGPKSEKAPTCTDCHGSHDMRPKSDPESSVARAKIPELCGTCHAKILRVFEGSTHGKLKQKGVQMAPGCTDCHSTHSIQQHSLPGWQVDVIRECGNCHLDFIKSYRDTFHGQVTALGFARIATCASCHGSHEILRKDDPNSRVSAKNRLETCRKCHANANANFVLFEPHANKHKKESGVVLYYTTLFMQWLLVGVFLTFGIHTVLWLNRSLRVMAERRRRARDGEPQEEKH
jgi:nitrate/TMAO reductase-like tetraheme cytochrome c subunit